jgi:hypothetical protein
MTMHDDIEGLDSGSESTQPEPAQRTPRMVGPESETRGGPEAPEAGLQETPPGMPPNSRLGERAALPAGSLPGPYLDTQGDENRQPPPNAPSPVNRQPTVQDTAEGEERSPPAA